jgi:hypothetical protein
VLPFAGRDSLACIWTAGAREGRRVRRGAGLAKAKVRWPSRG